MQKTHFQTVLAILGHYILHIRAQRFWVLCSKKSQKKVFAPTFEQSWVKAFIDSEIWGHSDDLLREIDDEYCPHPDNSANYSYELRNGSTAHVHMILSYALTRMIDKTECFMFLESSNSVTVQDSIKKTYSPWIFHELATVDTIEIQENPLRKVGKEVEASMEKLAEARALKVQYPIFGRRLVEINLETLQSWCSQNGSVSGRQALDILYAMTTGN